MKEPSIKMCLGKGAWAAAMNWVRADGSKAGVACCKVRPILLPQVIMLVQKTGVSVIDAWMARLRSKVTTETDAPPLWESKCR